MSLPAAAYQLVAPSDVTRCDICEGVYLGAGSGAQEFVSFRVDPGPDDPGFVPPGLGIVTHDEPGQVVIKHRPHEGRSITIRKKQVWCGQCVAAAARLIGFEDRAVLRDEFARQGAENAELREQLAAERERVADLEDAVAHLRRQLVIASVPAADVPVTKPKRRTPAKAAA